MTRIRTHWTLGDSEQEDFEVDAKRLRATDVVVEALQYTTDVVLCTVLRFFEKLPVPLFRPRDSAAIGSCAPRK